MLKREGGMVMFISQEAAEICSPELRRKESQYWFRGCFIASPSFLGTDAETETETVRLEQEQCKHVSVPEVSSFFIAMLLNIQRGHLE
jgi:hypothetical protein